MGNTDARTVIEHTILGQRVLYGTSQAGKLIAAELHRLGAARPMLIGSSSAAARITAIPDAFTPALTWDQVVQHVPRETVEAAAQAADDAAADVLVAVGGGSAIGLAKAVARASGLKIIAVPTTYSGSEATPIWGITEAETKTTGTDPAVLPVAVVYDAALSASLPRELSVVSGLNALAHCVDSLWAPEADTINQAHALAGARELAEALRRLARNSSDMQAREQALYGSYLAGLALSSAGSGLHHKLCHILGGTFALPHAETHTSVLPHVVGLNAPHVPQAASRLAAVLNESAATPRPAAAETGGPGAAAVQALNQLYNDVGAPRALGTIGFTGTNVDEAVRRAVEVVPQSNPTAVRESDLRQMLCAALEGAWPEVPDHDAQHEVEEELISRVLASFENAPDRRLAEILRSVVVHLHSVIREVGITEDEWRSAITFLTDVGHITTETRQEYILLSDVLGISMQTIAVNNPVAEGEERRTTDATVFGPFFVEGAPQIGYGGDISGGAPGQPCWVSGTVVDVDGRPIPRVRIEVWEADDEGLYDVQQDDQQVYGRGWLISEDDGTFGFWALTPTPYPIPHDGPVGRMLQQVGRSPYRAAHLHFMVSAPGYRTLVTHIFVEGDEQLERGDAVFGVKDSLIKRFEQHSPREYAPDGSQPGRGWASTRFDVVLARAEG